MAKITLKESENLRFAAEKEQYLARLLAIDILEGKEKRFRCKNVSLILIRPTGASGGLCIVRTTFKVEGAKQINHELFYFEDFYRRVMSGALMPIEELFNQRVVAKEAKEYIVSEFDKI